MREITDHKLNGLNDALQIIVMDEPGCGGANHEYVIGLLRNEAGDRDLTRISFQNGPILEAGFNGISNEALVAIVIDRMRGFQGQNPPGEGHLPGYAPFKSRENACALTHLEEALMWLQKRTRERMARGVEGTYAK